jgi:hypothetical protein
VSNRHEVAKVLKALVKKDPGWDYQVTGGGHYRITGPKGQLYFAAASPGDYRTVTNMVSHLRKLGAPL